MAPLLNNLFTNKIEHFKTLIFFISATFRIQIICKHLQEIKLNFLFIRKKHSMSKCFNTMFLLLTTVKLLKLYQNSFSNVVILAALYTQQ